MLRMGDFLGQKSGYSTIWLCTSCGCFFSENEEIVVCPDCGKSQTVDLKADGSGASVSQLAIQAISLNLYSKEYEREKNDIENNPYHSRSYTSLKISFLDMIELIAALAYICEFASSIKERELFKKLVSKARRFLKLNSDFLDLRFKEETKRDPDWILDLKKYYGGALIPNEWVNESMKAACNSSFEEFKKTVDELVKELGSDIRDLDV